MDDAVKELKRLQGVVARLAQNAGIDQSNPQRGINAGATPSVKNPVDQKLSSLADVQTYNVLDKQVLSWSQQGQKWLPVTSIGVEWRPATEDEFLQGDLSSDADWTSNQVIGRTNPSAYYGTSDSYGLVGVSDTSAYLHGAGRSYGGSSRAHGYVVAQPYYCKMGVVWIDDDPSVPWKVWGAVSIDRRDVAISTPQYQSNADGDDGIIELHTNWFYTPRFTTALRPVPPTSAAAGAQIYDTDLGLPLWWNGSAWANALGTVV
jgi:hypothetical protein